MRRSSVQQRVLLVVGLPALLVAGFSLGDGTGGTAAADGGKQAASPPPAVSNVTAGAGGGSDEVVVSWDALPAKKRVAFYRVYLKHNEGYLHLAAVTTKSAGDASTGRITLIDAFDYWPRPSGGLDDPRCYVVTAISRDGLEGAWSAEACGSPVGS